LREKGKKGEEGSSSNNTPVLLLGSEALFQVP